MKLYAAVVTDKETGEKMYIEREYETLKAFKIDLRCNGYAISLVSEADKFDEAVEKRGQRQQLRRCIRKARSESNKRLKELRKEREGK